MATTDPAQILRAACDALLSRSKDDAKQIIRTDYPFTGQRAQLRHYTEIQKTRIFMQDGFIDRYTGKRLVYIGTLRLFSFLMPDEFPFHPNWKIDSCHSAYWDLAPTLDHIMPVTRGGLDESENWITTSMRSNAAKSYWTPDELRLKMVPPGNPNEWDGLMRTFMTLVKSDPSLVQQNFIKKYYGIAKAVLSDKR